MRFAVFGLPISHSKSPLLFNKIFPNIPYTRVSTDNPKEVIKIFSVLNLDGANLTSPLKQTIIPFLDSIESKAKKLGSVNTIKRVKNKLIGFNTDIVGIKNSLKDIGVDYKRKNCLIVGSGGSATAIASIINSKAKVSIIGRTKNKLRFLAFKYGLIYSTMDNLRENVQNSDIIFYTLPRNVKNPIKQSWLTGKKTFLNSNYFLGDKNSFASNWLIHQAVASYSLFLKLPKDSVGILKKANVFSKTYTSKISLIGFMGVGKSVLAKNLKKNDNLKILDIDKRIESDNLLTISNIFQRFGEDYFRKIENRTLLNILYENNFDVLSTGGGTPLNSNNFSLLKNRTYPIWLYSDIKTILKRVKFVSKRPLFSLDEKELKRRLKKRIGHYFKLSNLLIDVNSLSIFDMYKQVKLELESLGFFGK